MDTHKASPTSYFSHCTIVPVCPVRFILISLPPLVQDVIFTSLAALAAPTEVKYPFKIPPSITSEVMLMFWFCEDTFPVASV